MFRVSVVRLVCLIWAIAMPAAAVRAGAGGQRQHRGDRHGTQAARRCPASPSPSSTPTPGSSRTVLTNDQGVYPRAAAAARRLHPDGGAAGLRPQYEQIAPHPQRRPDHRREHPAGGRQLNETVTVEASSVVSPAQAGPHRSRADDRRRRDPQPAAGLAQSLQLRVPAGQRHRLREQRVRRAAHQRQRLADAHELSARRQHQHREGSRRTAHAAGLGSAGPRGEGHHQRLRAGVRPDDRHGLQRHHAVGHQRAARLGAASASGATRCRSGRSSWRRPRASPTPRSTTSTATLGGPIAPRQAALLRRLRVRRSQPDHRRPGHHRHAGERGARSASRCRRAASSRRNQSVNFGFGKIDHQFNAEPTGSRRATSSSRTSPRRTSAAA